MEAPMAVDLSRILSMTLAFVFVAGCAKQPELLLPVEGSITVKKQPLATGTVVFYPDPQKGNKSKQEPRATLAVDQPGRYKLTTDHRDGAPSGWYTVTVYALKPAKSSVTMPEWLADQ